MRYQGTLRPTFRPDSAAFRHQKEREEAMRRLQGADGATEEKKAEPKSLAQLLELVSPEDSALIALIVFLLCDNTNNDVVLLGILLYVLLT